MVKFTRSDIVDIDLYEEHLRRNGYIAFDAKSMSIKANYLRSNAETVASFARDTMMHRSECNCFMLIPEVVYRYLTVYEHCPERYFFNRHSKTGKPSLDQKKVLFKLKSNNYATEFLDDYMLQKSIATKCSNVDSIIRGCNYDAGVNNAGIPLKRIPYSVKRQKNLRCNYKQFDIISQIPKEFCTDISVEEGYFLAWGDFAQSDLRIAYNLFLRSVENDKIMRECFDKYEGLARIVKKTMGQEFSLDEFRQERDLYKVLTLATMYGTRGSAVAAENAFISNFAQFLSKCPKYVEYEKRLRKRCALNLPVVVESYFGNQEVIPIIPYDYDTTVNDALNSPMQTGTSEIVILTVNAILEQFYSRGYTSEDVSVYYVRHDEPIFKISVNAVKDCWIFNQFTEILVDDWVPLALDFEFGYNYSLPDANLTKQIKDVYKRNEDKLWHLEIGTHIDTGYYPIPDSLELFVHWSSVVGKTIVVFYCAELNQVLYSLLETDVEEEILLGIKQKLHAAEHRVIAGGFRGVCIVNNSFDTEDFYGETYFRFKKEISVRLDKAIMLCKYMVAQYSQRAGLEVTFPVPDIQSDGVLSHVKDLEILILEGK